MPFVKVLRHGQITLPEEGRELLGIDDGQILEVIIEKTRLILKPVAPVDKGETLSPVGAKKVVAALDAYKNGAAKEFANVEALIKDLNS